MTEFESGCLCRSLAGHDRGSMFIILKAEAEYVYLADGRLRTVEKPKRKKKKHVQSSHIREEELSRRLAAGEPVRNEEIRYVLRRFRKENQSGINNDTREVE